MESLLILLYVAVGGYLIWCFYLIAKKAGYSPWFGLLLLIPIANLVIIGFFAFETWPIQKTSEQRRREKIDKLQKQLAELMNDKDNESVGQ